MMASIFNRSRLSIRTMVLPCTAAAALIAVDMAAATALIVRSSGPSSATYKPGKSLPDNAKVALRPGDSLTVLATDSTRTFRGPGTFPLASAGGGNSGAISGGRRGRFSALRTAGIVPRSPTLWHVDVSQSGKVCLADANNVMLWRPNASKAETLTVAKSGGGTLTAQWPAGQSTLAWPNEVPITSGAEYQLSLAGEAGPAKMKFATLPTVPTDLPSVAQALIEQNCDNQLELLIETVPSAG